MSGIETERDLKLFEMGFMNAYVKFVQVKGPRKTDLKRDVLCHETEQGQMEQW